MTSLAPARLDLIATTRGRGLSPLERLSLRLSAVRMPSLLDAEASLVQHAAALQESAVDEVMRACPVDPADLPGLRRALELDARELFGGLVTSIREGNVFPALGRAIRDVSDRPLDGAPGSRRAELILMAWERGLPERSPVAGPVAQDLLRSGACLARLGREAELIAEHRRRLGGEVMERLTLGIPQVNELLGEEVTQSKGRRDAEYILDELCDLLRSPGGLEEKLASYLAQEVFCFTPFSREVHFFYLLALAEAVGGVGAHRTAAAFDSLATRVDDVLAAASAQRGLDAVELEAREALEGAGGEAALCVSALRPLLEGLVSVLARGKAAQEGSLADLWSEQIGPQLPSSRAAVQGALLKACVRGVDARLEGPAREGVLIALKSLSAVARRLDWLVHWDPTLPGVRSDAMTSIGNSGAPRTLCELVLGEALRLFPTGQVDLRAYAIRDASMLGLGASDVEDVAGALGRAILSRGGPGATELEEVFQSCVGLGSVVEDAARILGDVPKAASAATRAGMAADADRYGEVTLSPKGDRDLAYLARTAVELCVSGREDELEELYRDAILAQLRSGCGALAPQASVAALGAELSGPSAQALRSLQARIPALAAARALRANAGAFASEVTAQVFERLPSYSKAVGGGGVSSSERDLGALARGLARALEGGWAPAELQAWQSARVLSYLRTKPTGLGSTLREAMTDWSRGTLDEPSASALAPYLSTLYLDL